MKPLLVMAVLAAAGTAQAATLFENGPVVNGAGLSILAPPATTFGFGAQTTANNAVAEDFTVPAGPGWTVESFTFYGYQTGSTAFTFTNATWSVVSGNVNTGTVVASGSTAVTSGGRLGYRVTSTTLGDTTRGIYATVADVPNFALGAGSYWLRWSLTGSLASGPWQPPTSDAAVGNGAQSTAGAAFATLVEAGSGLGTTLPFTITGSIVPEPATNALMVLGALAVLGAARRRAKAG
ncbi:MAG: PEP-CTERM sorting domain-containing protein [Chitinophagaceae bacterium]|nr:PEP-CTERM sorting domain-containing protein [Rubrivivax sp.]